MSLRGALALILTMIFAYSPLGMAQTSEPGPAEVPEVEPLNEEEGEAEVQGEEEPPQVSEEEQDSDEDGDSGDDAFPSLLDNCRDKIASQGVEGWDQPTRSRWPYVEWHGYFRVRGDLINEADLGTYDADTGTGTSFIKPSLSKNRINSSGEATFSDKIGGAREKTIGSANMRLRIQPVIHAWDRIRIGATVDLMDNMVLGSTPEFTGGIQPLVPLDSLTRTQIPPTAGVNSWTDSVVVKEAWAEWLMAFDDRIRDDSFNLGTLKVGRFTMPWGLGLVSNPGDYDRNDSTLTTLDRLDAMDANGGTYVDRLMWSSKIAGVHVALGYGWLATGPNSGGADRWYAQAYDLEQSDDITQIELALFQKPVGAAELEARRKALFTGRPVFDWGLYTTFRYQKNGVSDSSCCDETGSCLACYDSLQLVPKSAWLVTPDLWFSLDWRPNLHSRFKAQLEAVVNYGRVEHVYQGAEDLPVDIFSWGGAFESIYFYKQVGFGFDAGLASGDSADIMDPTLTGGELFGGDGKTSLMSFNADYIVDTLMFRQVLGTVTNTAYFRPHFMFDILPTDDNAFGGKISGLYAIAMAPDGYPGNGRHLGVEGDVSLFYEETNRFLGAVTFGVLGPIDAFDRPADFAGSSMPATNAEWSWILKGNLSFVF